MKRMLISLSAGCFFIALLIVACKKDEETPQTPDDSLSKAIEYAMTPGADLEQEFTVEAYYWNDGVPMLITDLSLLDVNSPLPRSAYVLLDGDALQLMSGKDEYLGALVRITGKMSKFYPPGTKTEDFRFRCPDLPEILARIRPGIVLPFRGSFCERFPAICSFQLPVITGKYALLYSGGINSANAHRRYWNDLRFMHAVLREKYGYSDENIIVVYKNGIGEDSGMTVDFAATPSGLTDAIVELQSRMNTNDDLFVFATNHGGGQHRNGGHQGRTSTGLSGLVDDNADEDETTRIDEVFFFYNSDDNAFRDDAFAGAINSIPRRQLVAVLEPCFSGGFLHDMQGNDAVIISACLDDELSYGGLTVNGVQFDFFAYYFTEALFEADASGNPLSTNPDTNGDGEVSMLEAFLYARDKDTADETPLLEANGDGVGRANPNLSDADGSQASNVFL